MALSSLHIPCQHTPVRLRQAKPQVFIVLCSTEGGVEWRHYCRSFLRLLDLERGTSCAGRNESHQD
jgi:hypothetical protein